LGRFPAPGLFGLFPAPGLLPPPGLLPLPMLTVLPPRFMLTSPPRPYRPQPTP
jgi:hypothetical protein